MIIKFMGWIYSIMNPRFYINTTQAEATPVFNRAAGAFGGGGFRGNR